MLLCLVLKLYDRDLGPGGKWQNYAKRVNGDKLGVLELKWEIIWNSWYLGFWSPGGGHCWDSMHFLGTFSWCKTEKRRGRKSKQHRGLHWWWSGLLVMVSVMDSDRTRVWWTGRWWPILPAGHRHQLGDTLQDIPVPCQPGKALHGTMNMVPYTDCFLSSIISHISLLLPSSLLSSLTLLEGVVIFLPLTQGTRAREVQRSHSGFLNSWVHAETPQLGGAFPARGNQCGSDLVLTMGTWKFMSSPCQEHFVSLQH